MIKYEVIIYWSEEDQAFIAEVPELPGCAADGATYREALTNVEVIIQECWKLRRNWAVPFLSPGAGCCMPETFPPRSQTPAWRKSGGLGGCRVLGQLGLGYQ